MKNTVIDVLNREHGGKVIEFFKSHGVDTREYEGIHTKEENDELRFYGVNTNGYFSNHSLEETLEKSLSIINLPSEKQTLTKTNMNLLKSKELEIKGVKRQVTVSVIVKDSVVYSGYSVRLPEDIEDAELAEKIATGRALKEKTNLTPDTELGKGMNKKYILHAIADNLLLQIERGVIVIKGVK